ncbi:uncharacterized protein A1O5_05831 [Cladophialophora psammophila CBS 110553]|uniref:Uncharacterized protein n=1 Tax=Cladophialophora psammophila CBS 110553 TaxID=1182543 RepID=W9X0M8_9EURO|nr:uncharacterized protein A1O5_05831 [Cladophialophora psammophila CBS 110553]EXJ70840.1 hypothetical protein A1O5_05831 [Cladophialophora psammophila CBS 110553]
MASGSSRSRPGIHQKRTDTEPRVYAELPSFPSFDEPIPPNASLEEVCIRYPNHLRGSYLDAFIQWHWSATDMYSCLTDIAINEFKAFGITTSKSFANRANFLMKRLDARLSALSPEEVTALCTAPKIRTCMMDGSEKYGASKLQGKFHNPIAPRVRTYPHRQIKARKTLGPEPVMMTFVHNDKEYPLWASAEEFDEYKASMATYWGYQRARAEQILALDELYGASQDSRRRNRLVLQMANWPCDVTTETFFSFQHIRHCPAFVTAISNMATAAVINIYDSFPSEDPAQQLPLVRQSAISYVHAGQAARLTRLNEFLSTLPAGEPMPGVVDQVLSWGVDLDGQTAESANLFLDPANPQGEGVASPNREVPHINAPVAPFRSSLKRTGPESAGTAKSTKRVRFADPTTEFGHADMGLTADHPPEEAHQQGQPGVVWQDLTLDEPDATQAIHGDIADFAPEPPMAEAYQDDEFDFVWPDMDLGTPDATGAIQGDDAIFTPEPPMEGYGDQVLPWPDPSRVICGEDVALTLQPPIEEMLEAFDLDTLPAQPLQGGFLDAGIDPMAADYSTNFEVDDSEWMKFLNEEMFADEGISNVNENLNATSRELPELVDDDE